MTYGEMRDYVLQLLDRYSVAGEAVAESYNNQADMLIRIPALTRDGLNYVATAARLLRTAVPLAEAETVGEWAVYDLPDDFYQMAGGLLRLRRGRACRMGEYTLLGRRQLWLPAGEKGPFLVEYYRYPAVPQGSPEEGDFLDCPPEAQDAVAYYVASHLVMEDNGNLYALLYNEFERKLARLQEGAYAQCGVTENVYDEEE